MTTLSARLLSALWLLALAPSSDAQLAFSDETVSGGLLSVAYPWPGPGGMLGGGAAAGDFNKDGWQDVFVLGRDMRPDMLFMNNGDGTFTDRALPWGIANKHKGAGVAVGDYDKNGWLDLYVTSRGPATPSVGRHKLYRNNGNGTFTNVAAAAGVNQTSPVIPDGFGAAFGDYDLDGDLDLFVSGWHHIPTPSEGNRLFRNNGDGTFTDTTTSISVPLTDMYGFSPTFVDMDGDRYPELIVASDFGTTHYLKNNGDGTFDDYTNVTHTGQAFSGMGSAVGDFDNNGFQDWFITAIYEDGGPPSSDGNKLHWNQGGHQFTESAAASGVDDGGWGWGAVAVDVDLDGWQDIVETNGWTTYPFYSVTARLWRNNHDQTFSEIAQQAGFNYRFDGLGVVHFDYDGDGDQDFLMTAAFPGSLRLFRNDQTTGHHWLRLFLDTSAEPALAPNGFGTRIVVRTGSDHQYRVIHGGCNHLTVSELSAHFGLGSATVVDELRVEWPDGVVSTFQDVPVDVTRTIRR